MPIGLSTDRLFCVFLWCSSQPSICSFSAAQALEPVRVLVPVRNIDEAFSPFVVAKEKGYFAEEGYDVTLIAVGGSNESAIQVSSGNAEVGAASPGEAACRHSIGKARRPLFLWSLLFQHLVSCRCAG